MVFLIEKTASCSNGKLYNGYCYEYKEKAITKYSCDKDYFPFAIGEEVKCLSEKANDSKPAKCPENNYTLVGSVCFPSSNANWKCKFLQVVRK